MTHDEDWYNHDFKNLISIMIDEIPLKILKNV